MPKIKKDDKQLQALREVSDDLDTIRRYRAFLNDESIACTVSFRLNGDKQPVSYVPPKGLEKQIRSAMEKSCRMIASNIVKQVARFALELDEEEKRLVGLDACTDVLDSVVAGETE